MTRRFPTPLFGIERGPDWAPTMVELAIESEGSLSREEFEARCRDRLRKPNGERYTESYIRRTFSTFIQTGIIRERDGRITVWKFGRRFHEGEIDYSEFVWRGIKQSWVLQGNYPAGLEGLRDAHHVVRHAENPLTRSQIRERLTDEFGYEYNDEGIRGYPDLLVHLGALEEVEDGYIPGPKSGLYSSRWRETDVFYQLERWLHHRGPSVEVPSDEIKQALSKYYMYRESGGWGRHRGLYKKFLNDFVRETSRESDVENPQIHTTSKYGDEEKNREEMRDRIKDRFNDISGRDLAGLYADTLEDILSAADQNEAKELIAAAGSGITRRDVREWFDDSRTPYTFREGFSLYDWQTEAIDEWF